MESESGQRNEMIDILRVIDGNVMYISKCLPNSMWIEYGVLLAAGNVRTNHHHMRTIHRAITRYNER